MPKVGKFSRRRVRSQSMQWHGSIHTLYGKEINALLSMNAIACLFPDMPESRQMVRQIDVQAVQLPC